jgi:hypothetical protein
LEAIVQKSLETGAESQETLLQKLRNTTDLKATYQTLDKIIREHKAHNQVALDSSHINSHLLNLSNQKQTAKTPAKVVDIIKQEQEFLAGLYGKLKHPECHSDNLINSIKNAHDNMRTDNFDKLSKFVTFLEKNTNDHTGIISALKSTNDLNETHQSLLKSYQAKYINSITNKVAILDAGKTITLDSKKFDCTIKFLDYVTKTRTHEYFPCKEIQKIQSKAIENHKQLELSKSKGLEMEL